MEMNSVKQWLTLGANVTRIFAESRCIANGSHSRIDSAESRLSQSYFSTPGHPRDDLVRRGGELFDLVGESGLNTLDQITKR